MSIVANDLPGARVLDLFAGSGALGLESLSRGASFVEFVELAPASLRALKQNIELLGAVDLCEVRRGDALSRVDRLRRHAFDLAFADPPYGLGMAERLAGRWSEVHFSRVLGVEHSVRDSMPPGGDTRRYGDTQITFYRSADD